MKKKHLQLAVGILISVAALWLAFKDINLQDLWTAIKSTNPVIAFVVMVITMASFYWRSFRWKIFVDPVKEIPAHRLFGPLMVGFAFNNVFPLRAGEFARPLALMKKEGVPYTAGFSTILLERVVDALTLLILLIALPFLVTLNRDLSFAVPGLENISLSAGWLQDQMPKISILAVVALAGFSTFLITPIRRLYIRILHALPVIPNWLKHKLEAMIEAFSKGFDSLKNPRALLLTVIHSAIIWTSIAFTFQFLAWGFPGIDLTYGEAIGFLVFTCLVITLPGPPGFWGLYEFGGMVALVLMGVVPNTPEGKSLALAYTMIVHFLQWLPLTVYGLWEAGRLSVSASDAAAQGEHAEEDLAEESREDAGVNSVDPEARRATP